MEIVSQVPRVGLHSNVRSPDGRVSPIPNSSSSSHHSSNNGLQHSSDHDRRDAATGEHCGTATTPRDRRVQTMHKIRQRWQRVFGVTFAPDAENLQHQHGEVTASTRRRVRHLWAGLDSDKEMYGLGDLCVVRPHDVIVVSYLNSSVLRLFFSSSSSRSASPPDKEASPRPPGTSRAAACELSHALCCLAQLEDELLAVTSSCSPVLTLVRVRARSAACARSLDMRRHYRALACVDRRTLALATYHSGLRADDVIDLVQLDEGLRSFTVLRTLSATASPVSGVPSDLFRAPYSLWVQPNGDIVLSDSDTPAVVGVSKGGAQTFRYRPDDPHLLDSPAGIVGIDSGKFPYVTRGQECVDVFAGALRVSVEYPYHGVTGI